MRASGRAFDQLREISLEPGFAPHAEGSCLIRCGNTHVLCTASVQERVPPFLRNSGRGWVTAEYGMLPRSTSRRTEREAARGRQSGRTQEIQRLIGRALRAVTEMTLMGERQIVLDCDVLRADGGTRTAAISGAYVALHQALAGLVAAERAAGAAAARAGRRGLLRRCVEGQALLDLDYEEDSTAEADANFVLTGSGAIVEIQVTAETRAAGARAVRRHASSGGAGRARAAAAPARGARPGGLSVARRLVEAAPGPGEPQSGQARGAAGAARRPGGRGDLEPPRSGLPSRSRTARPSPPTPGSRRTPRRAPPACRRWPTIPGSWSRGLDGRPGVHSARWAGPERRLRARDGAGARRARGPLRQLRRGRPRAPRSSRRCAWHGRTATRSWSTAASRATLVDPPRGRGRLRLRSDVPARRARPRPSASCRAPPSRRRAIAAARCAGCSRRASRRPRSECRQLVGEAARRRIDRARPPPRRPRGSPGRDRRGRPRAGGTARWRRRSPRGWSASACWNDGSRMSRATITASAVAS